MQVHFPPIQVPGMPPMSQMPMPPMPPGIGIVPPMGMMPGGPPPPGIHMGMEPPGLPPSGMTQDDQLKMAQHRAAMVLQEEIAIQQVRVGGLPLKHKFLKPRYKQYTLDGIFY